MELITDINQLDPNGTYSYADYLRWHFEEYVELFRGKIMRRSHGPLRLHQMVVGNIFNGIKNYLRYRECQVYIAPFDVRLPRKDASEDAAIYTVVQPDICIICDPAKLDEKGCVGAPDTVIEILSQGNINRDVKQKYALYEEHGIPEYWIVAPGEKTITVYCLNDTGRYELSGEYAEPGQVPVRSLPGFFLDWQEIFEE